MSLYEQINDSKNATANFASDDHYELSWLGLILSEMGLEDLDTVIELYEATPDWTNVAAIRRNCDIMQYRSNRVDVATKEFLTNQTMATNFKCPETSAPNTAVGSATMWGAKWARDLNFETDRWDAQDCFNGIHAVLVAETDTFYRFDVDAGTGDQTSGGRIFEKNQTGCTFLDFYEMGVAEAATDVEQCWTYLQTHWNEGGVGPPDRYDYAKDPGGDGWVWDVPDMLQVFGRYSVLSGVTLSNWDRIMGHVGPGYLDAGYASRHWIQDGGTQYEVIVHHNDVNNERRTAGTFSAYPLLHTLYDSMTDTQKGLFVDMLKGTGGSTQAWATLLTVAAGLFNSATDRFKTDSTDGAESDIGTARMTTLMFILGICPGTGRLAIPLQIEKLGGLQNINPRTWRWNEEDRLIRIPVFAGSFTFMYGATNVDYTFPRDGVYNVYFNHDYTVIDKVIQLSELPANAYLDIPVTYQKRFRQLHNAFRNAGMSNEAVTWRRMDLSTAADNTTGWFKKEYQDTTIEGLFPAAALTYMLTSAGSHTVKRIPMFTAHALKAGDRIVHNAHVFEVLNVEEIGLGSQLMSYRALLELRPYAEA